MPGMAVEQGTIKLNGSPPAHHRPDANGKSARTVVDLSATALQSTRYRSPVRPKTSTPVKISSIGERISLQILAKDSRPLWLA
jgi:hypothetical protein